MMKSDSNKNSRNVALVTGAGQGIGRGVAEGLVERGWVVHINVRDESKHSWAAASLGAERVHAGDLAESSTAVRAVDAVLAAEGRLDAVVHAVGPYATAPMSASGPSLFQEMWEGNVLTSLHIIDAARAALREASGSYLFFGCAGLERWRAREVTTAYISAKASLLVAMRSLALEEAQHGVRANMISPGFVPHEGAAPDTTAPDLHAKIPIGRPATMAEVTDAAAWLASKEATHVVGQNLEIAGGWML